MRIIPFLLVLLTTANLAVMAPLRSAGFPQTPGLQKQAANQPAIPLSTGGIYLSYEHFAQHTLSYPFGCPSKTDRLQLNNFLGGANIQVIRQGEKYALAKDTIFGYRDCTGADYRFYRHAPYHIIDTAAFYIYKYTRLEQGPKIARPVTSYYFSAQPSAPILLLTIDNLNKAFVSNPAFLYRLNNDCRSDADLMTWLPSAKTYKLKYAYNHAQ